MNVDGLDFSFPADWLADKYDEWSFYRNQFTKQQNGLKAVDLVVFSPEQTAYLIEVKDYRRPDAEKPSVLHDAITNKVIHTLAALLPAKLLANDSHEKALATSLLGARKLQVVAHIEQPGGKGRIVDLADLKQKLQKSLRAIDPHVKIVSKDKLGRLPWSVV
ncbi:hypothetical protein [Azonexus sp.]|uniref:hypothetical protein n=1 Tax=Azonexus sp. TaxID=1872668 RepID=UPI0027BA401E|nr:hypothetical protein [Azonexus sp.]